MTHLLSLDKKFLNTAKAGDFIHYTDHDNFLGSDKLSFAIRDSDDHAHLMVSILYVQPDTKFCYCDDSGLERTIVKVHEIPAKTFNSDTQTETEELLFLALKSMLTQDTGSDLPIDVVRTIRRRVATRDFGLLHDNSGTGNIYLMFYFEMPEIIELGPKCESIAAIITANDSGSKRLDRLSQIAIKPYANRFYSK